MILVDVYSDPPKSTAILYALLQERTPEQSISHRSMPTIEDHIKFFDSRPYLAWYLIQADRQIVGSAYLTHQNEIGIFIFKRFARKGYGKAAVMLLIQNHDLNQFFANVNPANQASIELFKGMGFKHIQQTYAFRR